MKLTGCPLCLDDGGDGGLLVFKNDRLRVIQAVEPGFPAFYRVVWNSHAAEFSDLSLEERKICMNAVTTVETTLRSELKPTKINLAALGNAVPHLHWHVVARFDWDSHFPGSVWAAPLRQPDAQKLMQVSAQSERVNGLLAAALAS